MHQNYNLQSKEKDDKVYKLNFENLIKPII